MQNMNGKTALGLDANVGAALCYINICLPIGLIYSIIVVVTEKTNKLVRFHAFQSLLLLAALIVVGFLIGIVMGIMSAAMNSTALSLGFQRASMLYREDVGTIYVMTTDSGVFDTYPDSSDVLPVAEPGPEIDTWIPGGIFGYLWHANPSFENLVGYAQQPASSVHDATVQSFDGGFMIVYEDTALIFYNDGTCPVITTIGTESM